MAQRRNHQPKRSKPRAGGAAVRPPVPVLAPKPVVHYGKPFVLLEDAQKATFIYSGSQWVRHAKSIAQCRVDCQVKALSQRINGMARYEICAPLDSDN